MLLVFAASKVVPFVSTYVKSLPDDVRRSHAEGDTVAPAKVNASGIRTSQSKRGGKAANAENRILAS